MKQIHSLADFYAIQTEAALQKLESSPEGLTAEKARSLLAVYGTNEITKSKKKGFLEKLLGYIIEPMVIILMIASGFSFAIKDFIEGFAILGVVIINTVISLIQDSKAERAVEELKKILSPQFKVVRDGNTEVIASKYIVPGDIIVFESGDILPADARVIDSSIFLFTKRI
jgi:Ca2+-transporting ATPase